MTSRVGAFGFLSILAILVFAPRPVLAEWDLQNRNAQDQDKAFLDVSVVNSSFAVAVGMIKQGGQDAAAVFFTRDGLNWQNSSPQTSGGAMDFHVYMSVWFQDESRGYVGGIGEIWVTDDGGASWTQVNLGGLMSGRSVTDITGLRPGGPAWAVTSTGQIGRSTDGGATWPELALPLGDQGLNRVVFVDEDYGWVCSGATNTDEDSGDILGYEGGGLALTTDGGATWQEVFSGESRDVVSIRFTNRLRGWMLSQSMSGSLLERTTDGGLTWETIVLPSVSEGGALNGFNDTYFFDGCEGLLIGSVGGNDWGSVWSTRDGGSTWVEFDREFLRLGQFMGFPIEAGLVTFDFVDRTTGWATGTNETLFRYDADEGGPDCGDDGGGDGGGDDGGGRCSCRAAGGERSSGWSLASFIFALAVLWGTRRRFSRN